MEIINNKLNSLPQQVEENMKNIQILARYIKEAYKTQTSLTTSSVSIAIIDTNATSDTTTGWLIDVNGLLFHITNGDGTNLLLEYYANLKGVTGATGATGNGIASITLDSTSGNVDTYRITYTDGTSTTFNVTNGIDGDPTQLIDDVTPSNDKTYSSNKIDVLTTSARDQAMAKTTMYFTKVTPVYDGSTYYEINRNDLINYSGLSPILYGGSTLVVLDNNNVVKEIYSIYEMTPSYVLRCFKRGNFSQGKQLYQHNINTSFNVGSREIHLDLTIINDSNTPLNYNSILNYLIDKGFSSDTDSNVMKMYQASGKYYNSNNSDLGIILGINKRQSADLQFIQVIYWIYSGTGVIGHYGINSFNSITDTIITL